MGKIIRRFLTALLAVVIGLIIARALISGYKGEFKRLTATDNLILLRRRRVQGKDSQDRFGAVDETPVLRIRAEIRPRGGGAADHPPV